LSLDKISMMIIGSPHAQWDGPLLTLTAQ